MTRGKNYFFLDLQKFTFYHLFISKAQKRKSQEAARWPIYFERLDRRWLKVSLARSFCQWEDLCLPAPFLNTHSVNLANTAARSVSVCVTIKRKEQAGIKIN